VELVPRNIRVNTVCPGAIDTPIFSKMGIPLDQLETVQERVLSTIPLKRFGNAKEVADVIAAQIESTYVTGSVWVVDGGVNT
jgi:NAD(P)-dependent dehydrogenase (short-subunit alcohol dehydrogenase family)